MSVSPGISGTHFDTSILNTLLLTNIRATHATLFIQSVNPQVGPWGLLSRRT